MYKLKSKPWEKAKEKVNIDNSYMMWILIYSAIFILIDTIFLFIIAGNEITSKVETTFAHTKIAGIVFSTKMSLFSSYASDSIIITFMVITVILGRKRIAYGYLFPSVWMSILAFLLIFPFAIIDFNIITLTRLIILLVPGSLIFIVFLKFINDIKWIRRSRNRSLNGAQYV